jgi:hypothetical protein
VAARLVKPGGLSDSTIYNECQALAFDALAIKVSGLHAIKGLWCLFLYFGHLTYRRNWLQSATLWAVHDIKEGRLCK